MGSWSVRGCRSWRSRSSPGNSACWRADEPVMVRNPPAPGTRSRSRFRLLAAVAVGVETHVGIRADGDESAIDHLDLSRGAIGRDTRSPSLMSAPFLRPGSRRTGDELHIADYELHVARRAESAACMRGEQQQNGKGLERIFQENCMAFTSARLFEVATDRDRNVGAVELVNDNVGVVAYVQICGRSVMRCRNAS